MKLLVVLVLARELIRWSLPVGIHALNFAVYFERPVLAHTLAVLLVTMLVALYLLDCCSDEASMG